MSLLGEFQDTVQVYDLSDGDFGANEAVTLRNTLTGCIQKLTGREAMEYDSSGERSVYIVFFSEDPEIHKGDFVRVTNPLGTTFNLRVITDELEADPSYLLKVWNVVGYELAQAEWFSG